jgi:ATP-dependent exoDNAse (exonuclease V) alpha subunit
LLVGDKRQHEAVEAGKPYQQLQDAGIRTARLDEILRQKDPALKQVVEHLSRGDIQSAMEQLNAQGRVHELTDRDERLAEIAREYAKEPEGTLVVSPDNQSRKEINDVIHHAMQTAGRVKPEEHVVRVLTPRQEITGADRQWASQYEPGDAVRYTKGSKAHGIGAGEYARVRAVDHTENRVIVERDNGERVNYDPRRLHGVTLYRETERAFSRGDRVQFTAPDRARHVANRELGTIEKIDVRGSLQVRLDSGRSVTFNAKQNPHFDHGYAVTSHSSQGQTADRVLIHVDTEHVGERLLNQRLAYVAVSRARYDAQIYTDDGFKLREALSQDISKNTALEVDASHNHIGIGKPVAARQSAQNLSPRTSTERAQKSAHAVGHQR